MSAFPNHTKQQLASGQVALGMGMRALRTRLDQWPRNDLDSFMSRYRRSPASVARCSAV